jgi:acyl-CoA thioesterase FadM
MPEREALNDTIVPDATCFGCGTASANGLHARIFRDEAREDGLAGSFEPPAHASGFEGIVHGGAIYTAFDCLASWTVLVLRGERAFAPLLRRGTITYHRPARMGRTMSLASTIAEGGARGQRVVVTTEARDPEGELLADGRFEIVQVDVPKLKAVLGVDALPATLRPLLDDC